MNFILKIVQGPNAGAEIALVEGINVKLGRGDECDIVLADQTLPDVVCEIEVGTDSVMLKLPDGTQEQLVPYHVQMLETTGIAIGPADAPWAQLVWPKVEPEKADEPKPADASDIPAPQNERKSNKLLIVFIVLLVLVVLLEFIIWLFWPFFNSGVVKVREFCQEICSGSSKTKKNLVSQSNYGSLEELAKAFNVEVLPLPNGEEGTLLKGNLEKSADRLRLTAEAYSIMPGVAIDLSDDESLVRASEELLNMLTDGALKVASAKNRKLSISGRIRDEKALRYVLEALKNDVKHIEDIDCSTVEFIPLVDENQADVVAVAKNNDKEQEKPQIAPVVEKKTVEAPPAPKPPPTVAKLPIVGVVTMPYPYLVLRNGSRVVEGAEFNGYVISKICEDVIILKNGDKTLEWRP